MSSLDLSPAIAAADSGRWSEVINYLHSVSIDGSLADRSQILDLALQVLIQGDFEEQWDIAKIIPKLGEIAVVPLLNLVNDPSIDPEDLWFVAQILGDLHRPEAISTLIEFLRQDEDLDLRSMAMTSLAKFGSAAIDRLADLLDTPDCAIAVTVLAQIRHSQTIEPLLRAIDRPEPQIRALAVEALGSFHDPRIPPILLAKLTDPVASVRAAAAISLSLRSNLAPELDLVRHLRPLLFDLDPTVCSATALGLARSTDPQAVMVLIELLMSTRTPQSLQSQAILALGWIGTRSALDGLAAALVKTSPTLTIEIVASIGKTERERNYASQLLVEYLRANIAEHSAAIKQEIAVALGNLGDLNTFSDLIRLLGDPTDRVKLYTIAAIAKLSPTLPPEISQLATRSDLPTELQAGIQMCLAHWQVS
jgi:HEAT repeat protein